jgi:hypothetical protein
MRIAITTNVYGRASASRTIHIATKLAFGSAKPRERRVALSDYL